MGASGLAFAPPETQPDGTRDKILDDTFEESPKPPPATERVSPDWDTLERNLSTLAGVVIKSVLKFWQISATPAEKAEHERRITAVARKERTSGSAISKLMMCFLSVRTTRNDVFNGDKFSDGPVT